MIDLEESLEILNFKDDVVLQLKEAKKLIKQHWKELSLKYHPDKASASGLSKEECREKQKEIHEARSFLIEHLDFNVFINTLTDIQLRAFKILGKDGKENALRFTNSFQITALEILGEDAIEDALMFVSYTQVHALNILGIDKVEDSLNFINSIQVYALDILGDNRIEDALKFTDLSKLKALKILGVNEVENALMFVNPVQIRALKILGTDKVEDALKFTDHIQTDELEEGASIEESLCKIPDSVYCITKAPIEENITKIIGDNILDFYLIDNIS